LRLPAIPSPVEHPIICYDRDRDRSFLYANPFFTERIAGLSFEESEFILNAIFSVCLRPEFIYSHEWRQGDVVIINNHATMHYGSKNVRQVAYRKIQRIMIEGKQLSPR